MFEGLYRHDGWNIGLVQAGIASLLTGGTPDVRWLALDRPGAFAADPFPIESGGTLFCFFELLPYATNRGHIAYVVLDPRAAGPLRVVDAIVAPHHLSYPYLLEHDGRIVCVPEAAESGRVTAYAARDFPGGWYEERTLIDGFAGVDNTLFEHDGRWWLLATDGRSGTNSELHVWYADTLFGKWRPHRANPVKRSLAGTRPGGRPFAVDGRLYRPAQDCSARYGGRLIVNEITALSPDHFSERAVSVIEPDARGPYAAGLHTANAGRSDVFAVDGNRLHFVPQQAARAILTRAKRTFNRTHARLPPV